VISQILYEKRCLIRVAGFVCQRACHVAAGHGYCHIGGQKSRPDDFAGSDPVAYLRVDMLHAAYRADSCAPAEQLLFRGIFANQPEDRVREFITGKDTYKFGGVGLLLLRFAGSGKMSVHVDQSRHDIMAGQIHKLIAFKIFIFVCDFFDFFPVGKNDLIRLRFHIFGTVQNNAMDICVFHNKRSFRNVPCSLSDMCL